MLIMRSNCEVVFFLPRRSYPPFLPTRVVCQNSPWQTLFFLQILDEG